jgi:hypothetical protein
MLSVIHHRHNPLESLLILLISEKQINIYAVWEIMNSFWILKQVVLIVIIVFKRLV